MCMRWKISATVHFQGSGELAEWVQPTDQGKGLSLFWLIWEPSAGSSQHIDMNQIPSTPKVGFRYKFKCTEFAHVRDYRLQIQISILCYLFYLLWSTTNCVVKRCCRDWSWAPRSTAGWRRGWARWFSRGQPCPFANQTKIEHKLQFRVRKPNIWWY